MTRYGVRHAHCGLWSWDGKPLADRITHDARIAAHNAFDTLWKGAYRLMGRGSAYKLLRAELGLTKAECHMASMDAETARRVPGAVARIRARIAGVEDES